MTFCLGIKVKEGLVGFADTRVTSGSECITARKVNIYRQDHSSIFVMTSGLRSVRDKVLTYFDELIEERDQPFDRLFKAVNAFAEQIRRVAKEDRSSLEESGLHFNIHVLIGGQLSHDAEHKLYLVYPQGNWVEVGKGTPYYIIGASGYGKPVLDRTLKYGDSLRHAMKVGCLAFDSTRISAADVDFPVDVVIYSPEKRKIIEYRYNKEDLVEVSQWWQDKLRHAIQDLPSDWIEKSFAELHTETP